MQWQQHKSIKIRNTAENDLNDIINVEKIAFSENSVAILTEELLSDKSAKPRISLLASDNNRAVGHILFTKCLIEGIDNCPLMHILAPLAVIPEYQNQGIGGLLIKQGLQMLQDNGSELIFVLGHIKYYPKFGFINDANKLGYPAPYPIPNEVKDAWMVMPTKSKELNNFGKVICANAMDKPEYWRE